MASKLLPYFEAEGALTITLANVASSSFLVGSTSTMIDNRTTRYRRIRIFANIALNVSNAATAGKACYFYRLGGDLNAGTAHRTDKVSGTAATGITVTNAKLVYALNVKVTPVAGDVLADDFYLEDPGPEWGLFFCHDTGQNTDGTAGNSWLRYMGEEPEGQ